MAGDRQSPTRNPCGGGPALRVLLVGINYEPEIAGIGPYTTGLANYLASEGHAVSVVTGVPHYPHWSRRPYIDVHPAANPMVYRYNHFIPRQPRALGRSLYELTWLVSTLRVLPVARPDVVIGVVPSLSGALLASLIARRCQIPLGIVFQDLIGSAAAQSGYIGGRRLAWLASLMELSLARRAAGVAIVAEGFRTYLEAGGIPAFNISRVRNWAAGVAPTAAPSETRRRLNWGPEEFICLHAGNMGQKQALDNLIEAARLLQDKGVTIVLAGDGNDRGRLVEKTRSLRVSNVRFLGVQPPGLYESMLQAADVLLLNQRPSVSDMALPSKLSSYFAAGRPVVAAVATESEAAREIRAAAAGIIVDPGRADALSRALMTLRRSPEVGARLGATGKSYAATHMTAEAALANYGAFLVRLVEKVPRAAGDGVHTEGHDRKAGEMINERGRGR